MTSPNVGLRVDVRTAMCIALCLAGCSSSLSGEPMVPEVDGGARDAGAHDLGNTNEDSGPPRDLGPAPVDAGPGMDGGTRVRSNLVFESSFETEEGGDPFYQFSNGQHCCDHSVTRSSAHARTGMYSFRAEVRRDDPSVSSGYRAELQPLGAGGDEGEKWYGWSIWFEAPVSGGQFRGTNGHYVQWHPDNSSGSASLALFSYGGDWALYTNPDGDHDATGHTDTLVGDNLPVPSERWIDIVFHVNWATGHVEMWVDGEKYYDVMDEPYQGQYFKFGINRWLMEDDWVIYYDDIRIGNEDATYEDVAP